MNRLDEVQRYEQHIDHGLIPLPSGQWVRFSDVQAALQQPGIEERREGDGWLLGPGGQILDGPSIEENIAVVPQQALDAAEERLKEIARGREDDPVQHARDYFEGAYGRHLRSVVEDYRSLPESEQSARSTRPAPKPLEDRQEGQQESSLRSLLERIADGAYEDIIGETGDLTVADQMQADARAALRKAD